MGGAGNPIESSRTTARRRSGRSSDRHSSAASHERMGQRARPGSQGRWRADDTAAIQRAVEEHPVLYFPSGMYRLTGSVHLRPDSVLIGFSPFTTQFTLADADPQFQGNGAPIPLLSVPQGGKTL